MVHHHEFWWQFFPKKELTQIYVCATLRSFAVSLIGLFIPLYLYNELGLSLAQTLYFYIFYSVVFAISTPFAAKFAARYGVKHSVLFSLPFYLIFVLLLNFLPQINTPLLLIGTVGGVAISFYWMGMHLAFNHASDRRHRGEEVGKRDALSISATMLGPLIGGIMIKYCGFATVFVLSGILLFFAGSYLLLSKEEHVRYSFSLRGLVDRKQWRNSLFFVERGVRVMAAGVIWPLFIFVILKDYFSMGLVGTVLSAVSALLVWITGKFSDRVSKRKIVRWTVGFESLSWFLRAAVSSVFHVFAATVFGALTFGIMQSPIGALEYDKAKKDAASYFVSREVFICLGRILLLIVVLMTDSLTGGLIFQGFASFAALLF